MDSSDFVQHYGLQLNQLHQQYVAQQHIMLNAYQFGGNTRVPPFHVISHLRCSQCPHTEQDVPSMIAHVKAVHQNAQTPLASTSAQSFVPPLPTSSRLYPETYTREKGTNDRNAPPVKTAGPKPLFEEPNWKFEGTKTTIEDAFHLPGLGIPINENWNKAKAERQAVEESLSPRSKPDGLAGREADARERKIAEGLDVTKPNVEENGKAEASGEGGKKGKKKKGSQK